MNLDMKAFFITALLSLCAHSLPSETFEEINGHDVRDKIYPSAQTMIGESSSVYQFPIREGNSIPATKADFIPTISSSTSLLSTTEKLHSKLIRKNRKGSRKDNGRAADSSDTTAISMHSLEFLSCPKISVSAENYIKHDNGTVYVPLYNMQFNMSNYIINYNKQLLICPYFFKEYDDYGSPHAEGANSAVHLEAASLVCSCISLGFIILYIFIFILDKDQRNLRGYCVLSLCVALGVAYMCTFVQRYIADPAGCMAIAMFTVYFFLASFFWMNVMAFDIWKSIRFGTIKTSQWTSRSIKRQLSIYSLHAWGTPLVIAMSSVIVHHTTTNEKYRLIFRLTNCWFQHMEALWLYFAGPVFTLVGINFLVFAVICHALQKAAKSGVHSNFGLKTRLIVCFKLNSVMGLTWIFGIIAEFTRQEWLMYPYVILSALQGLFIFLSFGINKKTKKFAKGLFCRKKFPLSSSCEQTKVTNSCVEEKL